MYRNTYPDGRIVVELRVAGSRFRLADETPGDPAQSPRVDDDGVGLPPVTAAPGVGLGMSAMAERAAELGGSCLVGAGTRGGTSVVAVLPLRALS